MMFFNSVLTLRPQYNPLATHSPTGGFGGLPYKVFVYRARSDPYDLLPSYGLIGLNTFALTPGGAFINSTRAFAPDNPGGSLGGGWFAPGSVIGASNNVDVFRRVVGVWASNGLYVVHKSTMGAWGSTELDRRGVIDACLIGSLSYPLAVAYILGEWSPMGVPFAPYPGRTVLRVADLTSGAYKEVAYADPPTIVVPTRLYWASGSLIVVAADCVLTLRPAFSGNILVYDSAQFVTVVDTRYFAQYRDFVVGIADGTLYAFSLRGIQRIVDPIQQVVVPGDPRYSWSSVPSMVSSGSGSAHGLIAFGYRTGSGSYRTFLVQEVERNFCLFEWTSMPGVPAICDTDLCFYDFDVFSNSWLKVFSPGTTYNSSGIWETGFIAPSPGKRTKLRSVTLYGDSGDGVCEVTVEVRASDDGKSVVESYGPAIHVWSGHALQVPLSLGPREWYQFSWKFNKSSNLTSPPYVLFWRLEVEGEV
jgi:hypothetical protein